VEITACKSKLFKNPIIDFRNQEISQCSKEEINNLTSAIVSAAAAYTDNITIMSICNPGYEYRPCLGIFTTYGSQLCQSGLGIRHQGQFQRMKEENKTGGENI
jgi:hypothetical protein